MITQELLIKLADRLEKNARSITSHNEASEAVYYTLMCIASDIRELVEEEKQNV